MYLSAVPFAQLGFKTGLRDESYPKLTWEIIEKIPPIVGIGGVTLFGLMWVINRRIELKNRLLREKEGKE